MLCVRCRPVAWRLESPSRLVIRQQDGPCWRCQVTGGGGQWSRVQVPSIRRREGSSSPCRPWGEAAASGGGGGAAITTRRLKWPLGEEGEEPVVRWPGTLPWPVASLCGDRCLQPWLDQQGALCACK